MAGPRILLVDDSAFTCEVLGGALRGAGFDIVIAHDLWDLEADAAHPPALVVIDVVLQEAFGDDVAAVLRGPRGYGCPILLLSSLPDAELAQRAAEAGVDGYVSKRAGVAGVVARIRRALAPGTPAPAVATEADTADSFRVTAHHRVRRVVHIASEPNRWNAAAIVAEMHALAGDADLVGATSLADAARACREAVERHGTRGSNHVISVAIDAVAALVGDHAREKFAGRVARAAQRKLLVVDDSDFYRATLLSYLDAAGHVVVEARTLAEARQKLSAADYDLILLDVHLEDGSGPALIPEIRERAPSARIAILTADEIAVPEADAVLTKRLRGDRLLAHLDDLMRR